MKQPTIVIIAIAFVLGVALASWPLVGLAALPVVYRLVRRYRGIATLGIVAGVLRVVVSPLAVTAPEISLAYAGAARVEGQPVVTSDTQRVTLRLIDKPSSIADRLVLADVPRDAVVAPGDHVVFRGTLRAPQRFDSFDYPRYLAVRGIGYVSHRSDLRVETQSGSIASTLYRLRVSMSERIATMFQYPGSAFINGVLLGDQSGITTGLEDTFRRTGTTHVLVVSGFNISILAAVVITAFGRRPGAVVLSLGSIAAFVLLVGPSAAVVRAALMAAYLLVAITLGRPQTALTACAVTACVLLVLNPWLLRFDAGFSLSFAATLGVLLLSPWFDSALRLPGVIGEALAASLAATIATLPVSLIQFHQFSLVGPLANVLIVPVVPLLMAAGAATLLSSYVVPLLSTLLGSIISIVVALLIRLLEGIAAVPFASISTPSWLGLACILGYGIHGLAKKERHAT